MDHFERAKQKLSIKSFNEMQKDAFEVIPKGLDTLLLSITGSGKTLAFLLPLIAKIDTELKRTQLLIVAPTRELALQITSVATNLAMGLNITCCYGGHPVRFEKKALETNPEIVVGTPGRLLDHMDRENLDPLLIKYLVLDEFDKTLVMGFHKQMESIIRHLRYKPQYILTSATEAIEIPSFLPLSDLKKINHIKERALAGLQLSKVVSPSKDKLETLLSLINDVGDRSTFIFCNYRESVQRISEYLSENKISNDYFHGGLDQIHRENVMSKFRNGSTAILVTTDLAGRGLDIPHVENIVHYHLPSSEEVFTHRNGRTARMKAEGDAFVIISEEENAPDFLKNIDKKYEPSSKKRIFSEPEWVTIMINKGKRDKIRKGDVVGFLFNLEVLDKDELGLIEVKDNYALAAVRYGKGKSAAKAGNNKKIKGKKALVRLL